MDIWSILEYFGFRFKLSLVNSIMMITEIISTYLFKEKWSLFMLKYSLFQYSHKENKYKNQLAYSDIHNYMYTCTSYMYVVVSYKSWCRWQETTQILSSYYQCYWHRKLRKKSLQAAQCLHPSSHLYSVLPSRAHRLSSSWLPSLCSC